MTRTEKAISLFNGGYNCAQAVFGAFADENGLSETDALRIAACFGGGMQAGEVCGAATGALMTLGRRYPGTVASRPDSNAATRQFNARFREACGALQCRELLGYDFGTPEGIEASRAIPVRDEGGHDPRCAQCIIAAVSILEEKP